MTNSRVYWLKKTITSIRFSVSTFLSSLFDDIETELCSEKTPSHLIEISEPSTNQKTSLDKIVHQQKHNVFLDNYKEFSILYTIIQYLTNMHLNNQVHGNLRLSNIILDENDSLSISNTSFDGVKKNINFIVSLSPEAIFNQEITEESDIYSFAVIILQVLTHKINIFSDYSNDINILEQLIMNNIKPLIISENVPTSLINILHLCFSKDKSKRPTAMEIQSILEKIYKEKLYENQIKKSIHKKIVNNNKKKNNVDIMNYENNRCVADTIDYDEEEDYSLKEENIEIIMQQCNISRRAAIKALKEANGDLITAVMNLAL